VCYALPSFPDGGDMMKRIIVSLLLVLLSIPAISAEVKEVIATGMGNIIAGDIAHAKDDAVEDALRNAVEEAVGTLISSQSLVENYQLVEDRIYSESSGYVKSYKIISKTKSADTYTVKIKAKVKLANLEKDLVAIGLIIKRKGMPRMMVIIDERTIGVYDYADYWINMNISENTIIDCFKEKGFHFVDQAVAKRNVDREKALAAIAGNDAMATAIGLTYKAEVVIVGKAIAKTASGASDVLGGMKSCQANISARAINVDNGKILATGMENAAKVHIDEVTGGNQALEEAAKKFSDKLIRKILKEWVGELSGTTTIQLVVNGLKSFDDLDDFTTALKYYIRGVKDVHTRDFVAGVAILDVETKGSAKGLARELKKKDLKDFTVKVTGVSANRVSIEISRKGVEGEVEETQPE